MGNENKNDMKVTYNSVDFVAIQEMWGNAPIGVAVLRLLSDREGLVGQVGRVVFIFVICKMLAPCSCGITKIEMFFHHQRVGLYKHTHIIFLLIMGKVLHIGVLRLCGPNVISVRPPTRCCSFESNEAELGGLLGHFELLLRCGSGLVYISSTK